MSTELVLPSKIQEIAQNSNLELTTAERIASAYVPFLEKVTELGNQLKPLNKEVPEDAIKAKRVRLDLGKLSTPLAERKKADKESILIQGRYIDSLYNAVEGAKLLTQKDAEEIEKYQENLENERKAKLKEERIALLLPYGVDTQFITVEEMPEESFNELVDNAKLAYETKLEKERIAELERIEAEKKAEAERLERLKAEEEERQRIIAENKKLKAEREQAEKERLKLEAIRKKEIEEQNKKLEAERKEREKVEAELRAKKEAEDKAIQDEKARIEAEEAEKLAKEKALLLAPDKEKVKILFEAIKGIVIPEFSSEEGKAIGKTVKEALEIVKKGIIQESNKLL